MSHQPGESNRRGIAALAATEQRPMRELMRELKWTEADKKLSRRAFDVALQVELAEVLKDCKAHAAALVP